MPRRHRRIGAFPRVERKDRAFIWTDIKCGDKAQKVLQDALRFSRPKTTCHDIVVECGKDPFRLTVRASCTSPKTKAEFEEMASAYAKILEKALS